MSARTKKHEPTEIERSLRNYLRLRARSRRVVYVCHNFAEARARVEMAARIADREKLPPVVSTFDFIGLDHMRMCRSVYVEAVVVDPLVFERDDVPHETLAELHDIVHEKRVRYDVL